jgi:hypothetical protein
MSAPDESESGRSAEACPVCGRHALHLLYFPTIDVTGVRPYNELLAMGDVRPDQAPGIGCQACGTEWANLGEFRRAQESGAS